MMKHASRWLFPLFVLWLAITPTKTWGQTDPASQETFPLPTGLEKAVDFWRKIFSEYRLSQLVFFDPLDMSKIYDVLDVSEENRSQTYIDGERARIAAAHNVDVERVRAQRGIKERTIAGLQRSGRYMRHIEQVFRDKNLPLELGYLPLVESSFDINARSSVGATGMWQFMRATGKEFRLRIDRVIDERKDPLESTRAAAALLEQNYQLLGNWPLALTAYNYGAGGIARAVDEVQSDNLVDLIQNYNHRYWGFAAKNFYAEFLAAVDIARNVDQYFPGLEIHPAITIREFELTKGSSFISLANSSGLTREQFLEWNPALSPGMKIVPAGYRVKLPAERKLQPTIVEVAHHQPRQEKQQEPPVVRHRVKRGETILQIAKRYGASVDRILQVNGIRKAHLLQVGMTLLVPKT
jgi:membrane-bound lytic murein transglycosylase D